MTDAELTDKIEKLIIKLLPNIFRNHNNSIRDGIISSPNMVTRTCNVQIIGTNEILNGIKYIASDITNVSDGQLCLILSSDPKVTNYAIIFN